MLLVNCVFTLTNTYYPILAWKNVKLSALDLPSWSMAPSDAWAAFSTSRTSKVVAATVTVLASYQYNVCSRRCLGVHRHLLRNPASHKGYNKKEGNRTPSTKPIQGSNLSQGEHRGQQTAEEHAAYAYTYTP